MAFLGFVNYLRDYVPLFASLTAPLEPLRKLKRIGTAWTPQCQSAFDSIREILSSAPALQFPLDSLQLVVAVDASQLGVAAVLFQELPTGEKRYITFVSKSLNKAQRNYPATRRELLAIVFALQRLREYLYGVHFELRTDHQALTFLFTQKHVNYMLLNWIGILLDYSFTITHCPGILNILPDALSRLYPPFLADLEAEVVEHEVKSVDSHVVRRLTIDSLAKFPDRELVELVEARHGKSAVPVADRKQLTQQFHLEGHFGAERLFKKIWTAGFFWPKLMTDCRRAVAECKPCIRFNIASAGFQPLRPIAAVFPFDHIAIDLASLQTTPRGNNYIFVLVDVASRFCLLRSLRTKDAASIARILWEVICDFGVPKIIQSDNGSEFKNQVIKALASLMGIDHRLVSPYNPRANGLAERFVRTTKLCLFKMLAGNTTNWDLFLPSVQRSLNINVLPLHKSQPHALMFARPANPLQDYSATTEQLLSANELAEQSQLMVNLVYPEAAKLADSKRVSMKTREDKKRHRTKPIPVGSMVMIVDEKRSSKSEPYWVGPYKVLSVNKGGAYSLLTDMGDLLKRRLPSDKIKPISALAEEPGTVHYVDQLLDHKGPDGDRRYLVSWYGFDASHNTWEPEGNIHDATLINKYWKTRAEQGLDA
jgi:transposase InsO family protein